MTGQIFLVQNDLLMAEPWEDVEEVFENLAYLLKPLSPNGLELLFTTSFEAGKRSKDVTPLLETLRRGLSLPHCSEDLLKCLGKITGYYQAYQTKVEQKLQEERGPENRPLSTWLSYHYSFRPTTVYLFLNSSWGYPDTLTDTIRGLISMFTQVRPGTISVQFVMVGHPADGLEGLRDVILNWFGEFR